MRPNNVLSIYKSLSMVLILGLICLSYFMLRHQTVYIIVNVLHVLLEISPESRNWSRAYCNVTLGLPAEHDYNRE